MTYRFSVNAHYIELSSPRRDGRILLTPDGVRKLMGDLSEGLEQQLREISILDRRKEREISELNAALLRKEAEDRRSSKRKRKSAR